MKSSFIIIYLILINLYQSFYAEILPVKWGRVNKEDFDPEMLENFKTKSAVVVCDYGRITFSNRTFYYRYKRIKINSKDGLKYAKIEIPYFYFNNYDDFLMLKVNLYLLENGTIKKIKYDNDDFEDIIIDEHRKIKVLNIKAATENCIIEYKYEIASLDLVKLRDWYFQSEIPTLWSGVEVNVPFPMTYLVTLKKYEYLDDEEQIKCSKNIEWLKNTNSIKSRLILEKNNFILYESPSSNYKVFVLNNRSKFILMKNLDGIDNVEGFVSIKDYYPRVSFDLFEITGYFPWLFKALLYTTYEDYIFYSWKDYILDYPHKGYIIYRLKNWDEFNKDLLQSKFFGGYFNKKFDCSNIFSEICKDTVSFSQREKMILIYNYLVNKIKWTGNFKMYPFKSPDKLFDDGIGHSGDLNMFYIYLLNKIGIQAYPLLIRTNDLGKPEKIFPVHGQFNHVIAYVVVEGNVYLIDLTNYSKEWNKLPEYDLNTLGWKVHPRDYGWIDISLYEDEQHKDKFLFVNKPFINY